MTVLFSPYSKFYNKQVDMFAHMHKQVYINYILKKTNNKRTNIYIHNIYMYIALTMRDVAPFRLLISNSSAA